MDKVMLEKNLSEYFMTLILSLTLTFSAIKGFGFQYFAVYVIGFEIIMVALFIFLLNRLQIVILLLTALLALDAVIFYRYRDLMIKAVAYIDGFIRWIYIYMNESDKPANLNLLTDKYRLFTIVLTCILITFAITLFNAILKSHVLTLFCGILFFVFQWYNYVDSAYMYMMFYIAVGFVNIALKDFFKHNRAKAPVAVFLAIVTLMSSISSFSAAVLPKNFGTVTWDALNDRFYEIFPFTENWRNGRGQSSQVQYPNINFTSFSTYLGGAIAPDNQVVLKVKADNSTYLRGMVYDTYLTNRWVESEQSYVILNKGSNISPSFNSGIKYTLHKIEIQPVNMKSNILFSPWQPYKTNNECYYELNNLNLRSKSTYEYGQPYTVEYIEPQIDLKTIEQKGTETLSGILREKYLRYPSDLPQRVKDLAQKLTVNKSQPYDKAKAIEEFLRTYKYSLDVPPVPKGRDFVDYFLFDLKKGYCTYYATSMVIMLRTIGIPARYVVGFKMPSEPSGDGYYTVTTANAHAWVEAYFDDYGWVTFEPTAAYPVPDIVSSISSDSSTYYSNVDHANTISPPKVKQHLDNTGADVTVKNESHKNTAFTYEIIAAVPVFVSVMLYVLLKKRRKHIMDNKDLAVYYYSRILRYLSKKGIKKYDSETAVEYQNKVMRYGLSGFDRVTQIYNDIVYGNIEPKEEDVLYVKDYIKSLKKRNQSVAQRKVQT